MIQTIMIAVEYDNVNFLRVEKDSTFYFSLSFVTSSTSNTMSAAYANIAVPWARIATPTWK